MSILSINLFCWAMSSISVIKMVLWGDGMLECWSIGEMVLRKFHSHHNLMIILVQ